MFSRVKIDGFVCAGIQVFGTASVMVSPLSTTHHHTNTSYSLTVGCHWPWSAICEGSGLLVCFTTALIIFPSLLVHSGLLPAFFQRVIMLTQSSVDVFLYYWCWMSRLALVNHTQVPKIYAKLSEVSRSRESFNVYTNQFIQFPVSNPFILRQVFLSFPLALYSLVSWIFRLLLPLITFHGPWLDLFSSISSGESTSRIGQSIIVCFYLCFHAARVDNCFRCPIRCPRCWHCGWCSACILHVSCLSQVEMLSIDI